MRERDVFRGGEQISGADRGRARIVGVRGECHSGSRLHRCDPFMAARRALHEQELRWDHFVDWYCGETNNEPEGTICAALNLLLEELLHDAEYSFRQFMRVDAHVYAESRIRLL